MARFIVRMPGLAAVLAFAGLGCAAAGPLAEREIPLAPDEWQQLRAVLAWPRQDLPIRSVRALQRDDSAARVLDVEIASVEVERFATYRTWWRVLCSNATGGWKCDPPEAMVAPARGGAVALGAQASPEDVVLLAQLLGHAPGRSTERELLSVQAAGALYVVSYRLGACEHLVRLRRDGDQFLLHPHDREIRACP